MDIILKFLVPYSNINHTCPCNVTSIIQYIGRSIYTIQRRGNKGNFRNVTGFLYKQISHIIYDLYNVILMPWSDNVNEYYYYI